MNIFTKIFNLFNLLNLYVYSSNVEKRVIMIYEDCKIFKNLQYFWNINYYLWNINHLRNLNNWYLISIRILIYSCMKIHFRINFRIQLIECYTMRHNSLHVTFLNCPSGPSTRHAFLPCSRQWSHKIADQHRPWDREDSREWKPWLQSSGITFFQRIS